MRMKPGKPRRKAKKGATHAGKRVPSKRRSKPPGRIRKSKTAKSGTGRAGKDRKVSGKRATEKFIPEFMRERSERSKAQWRKRWDRGTAPIGREGQRYIERTYGPHIQPDDFGPVPGGSGGVPSRTRVTPSHGAGSQGRDMGGRDRYPDEELVDDFDVYDDYDFYDREY